MHCIEGLVAQYGHLKAAQEHMAPAAHIALLAQGFGLLLMTEDETNNYDDYFDNLPFPGESVADDFYTCRVSETLLNFASELSRTCPVVYVGTCYWGGDGVQCAGLWENGQMLEQPIWTRIVGVISAALKKIGVEKNDDFDEFDAIHLGWYRNNRDWISFAQHGKARWEADTQR